MTREEILKVAKPILFNTDMVRAILDDRKTTTRRVIKGLQSNTYMVEHVDVDIWEAYYGVIDGDTCIGLYEKIKPPYRVGNYLYVRETWNISGNQYQYKEAYRRKHDVKREKWKPSIHMPKEAARILLKVADVRVERLKDIAGTGTK